MTEPTFPEGSLISYPREDGAVQHKDWNEYLDTHRHPTWANRWMFLQDTVVQFAGKLSQGQLLNNYYNAANTRFMIGMMTTGSQAGLSTVGWNWLPYDVSKGSRKRAAISDALAFTADYPIPSGFPDAGATSVGTWAKDIPGLIPQWEAMGFWCNFNPPVIRSALYDLYVKLNTPPEEKGEPVKGPDRSLPNVGPEEEEEEEEPKSSHKTKSEKKGAGEEKGKDEGKGEGEGKTENKVGLTPKKL